MLNRIHSFITFIPILSFKVFFVEKGLGLKYFFHTNLECPSKYYSGLQIFISLFEALECVVKKHSVPTFTGRIRTLLTIYDVELVFAKIVNGLKSLTIFSKNSVIDV